MSGRDNLAGRSHEPGNVDFSMKFVEIFPFTGALTVHLVRPERAHRTTGDALQHVRPLQTCRSGSIIGMAKCY